MFDGHLEMSSQPSKVDLSEMEYHETVKRDNLDIEESALIQQR